MSDRFYESAAERLNAVRTHITYGLLAGANMVAGVHTCDVLVGAPAPAGDTIVSNSIAHTGPVAAVAFGTDRGLEYMAPHMTPWQRRWAALGAGAVANYGGLEALKDVVVAIKHSRAITFEFLAARNLTETRNDSLGMLAGVAGAWVLNAWWQSSRAESADTVATTQAPETSSPSKRSGRPIHAAAHSPALVD